MKRSPLRKLSGKRRKQVNEYMKLRKKYLEDHPTCEACNVSVATQIHHIIGRDNEKLKDVRYFLAVDQSCHSWIHANPEASRKAGWMLDKFNPKNKL